MRDDNELISGNIPPFRKKQWVTSSRVYRGGCGLGRLSSSMETLRKQKAWSRAVSPRRTALRSACRTGVARVVAAIFVVLVCADLRALDYVLGLAPPRAGVSVYVDGALAGTTDENGKVLLASIEPGSREVRVQAEGLDRAATYEFDPDLNVIPDFDIGAVVESPVVNHPVRHVIETGVVGATILVDGTIAGTTRADGTAPVNLLPWRFHTIVVDLPGHEPEQAVVKGMLAGGRISLPPGPARVKVVVPPIDPILVALVCILGASLLLLVVVLVMQHRRRGAGSTGHAEPEQGVGLFDRYRIVSTLGSGGVGMIYRAYDVVAKSAVALKILDARWLNDPDMVRKFLSEGEVLHAVAERDPEGSIVRCFRHGREHGSVTGRPFISLELLEGETLQACLKRQPVLQELTAAGIALQIASALKTVHAAGVVHRDLTPDNIFLKHDNVTIAGNAFADVPRVVLIDFGIARVDIASKVTMDGSIAGKPQYMSPEQCRGLTVDARSDLYSLGIVMFLMVAGRTPFDGRDPFEVMRAQQNAPPPMLSAVSPHYLALTHGLLAKEAHARPQTAALVAAELETLFMFSGHTSASTNLVPFPERRLLP